MSKVLIIITEGSQDSSFIYFILTNNGYKRFSKPLAELQNPVNTIILEHVKEKYPENMHTKYDSMLFLPYILIHETNSNIILIYSLNGKDDIKYSKSILLKYFTETFNLQTFKPSFAFIFDADSSEEDAIKNIKEKHFSPIEIELPQKKSVGNQINTLKTKYQFLLNNIEIIHKGIFDIEIKKVENVKPIKFGFYFLPSSNPNIGTLDYLTFPLMRDGNEKLFDNTEHFVQSHKSEFSDTNSFISQLTEEGVTKTAKYYKTIIGIAGQFEEAGSSNAVFYKNGVYLKNNTHKCKDIIDLINNLLQ